MSPVAKWHKQCSLLMFGACVPLPHPGGPVVSRERYRQSSSDDDVDDVDDDFDGITSQKMKKNKNKNENEKKRISGDFRVKTRTTHR